jgi:LysM repeat protein
MLKIRFFIALCVVGSLIVSGCASARGMTRLEAKNEPVLKRGVRADNMDTEGSPAGGARPVSISTTRVHSVKKGETLSSIASAYGTSEGKLAEVNTLSNPKRLRVGQKLQIPDPNGAVAPTFPSNTPATQPLPMDSAAPF